MGMDFFFPFFTALHFLLDLLDLDTCQMKNAIIFGPLVGPSHATSALLVTTLANVADVKSRDDSR